MISMRITTTILLVASFYMSAMSEENNGGRAKDVALRRILADDRAKDNRHYHPQVRLVDGSYSGSFYNGRVEVRKPSGSWGNICDDYFDDKDALVICKMLGYKRGKAKKEAFYGRGDGNIWMDSLVCKGDESSIFECPYDGWGNHDCKHREDAGVECQQPGIDDCKANPCKNGGTCSYGYGYYGYYGYSCKCTNGWTGDTCDTDIDECKENPCQNGGTCSNENGGYSCKCANGWTGDTCDTVTTVIINVRLIGFNGPNTVFGRLEVYLHGQWGTVCDDQDSKGNNQENDDMGRVVCRMLGKTGGRVFKGFGLHPFTGGPGPIWMDDVNCSGNEQSIFQCPRKTSAHDCSHREDVAISCPWN